MRLLFFLLIFFQTGCFERDSEPDQPPPSDSNCAGNPTAIVSGTTGNAMIFNPDPMSKSGDPFLSPTSHLLNNFRDEVALNHLTGRGILEGKYVDVKNGIECGESFGAYSTNQNFTYLHENSGFQEAMTYFFGTLLREDLDQNGILKPTQKLDIVSHCMMSDNAYYYRGLTESGAPIEKVCLGDSIHTRGASFSDDATVVLHEALHATSGHFYSSDINKQLGSFWYDEAGAINEAVSDFGAMSFVEESIAPNLDSKLFSRWALGTFSPGINVTRGAHFCPIYDPGYPQCLGSEKGPNGYSADLNKVSFAYPDGLGWPHGKNTATSYLRDVFLGFSSQEEIHGNGILLLGALWDAYEKIKENHLGDALTSRRLLFKIIFEALALSPLPDNTNLSPVTMPVFAEKLKQAAQDLNIDPNDQSDLKDALINRGLLEATGASDNWAEVIGFSVVDNPIDLIFWVSKLGGDPAWVTQTNTTGLNEKPDPGELLSLWFNIKNNSETTAAGVQVFATIENDKAKFWNEQLNDGFLDDHRAQVQYSKINGSNIVNQLTSTNPTKNVPTGNTYFKTNPYFKSSSKTGLWLKIDPGARRGDQIPISLRLIPSIGDEVTLRFVVAVN